MNRTRSDLIRVGIFTAISGSLLVGSLLWIAGSQLFQSRDPYTVLFEDSVSGLNAGSNVEYQGVVVGRVRDIQLSRDIPPKVEVVIDLRTGTQVRRDTVAALLGSLVTGIQYIELQGGTESAGPLSPGDVIPGIVSSLVDLRNRATKIGDLAITILERLEKNTFTEENSIRLNELVADLAAAAERLNRVTESLEADDAGKQLVDMVGRVSHAADAVDSVFVDLYAQRELYGNLRNTLASLDAAIADARELVGPSRIL